MSWYHQHILCTSTQALKQRCLPVLNVRTLSIPLHLLDTVQSTLFFFALFIPKALINHGWAISISSSATSKTRRKHHNIVKRLSQTGYPAGPTGQEAKEELPPLFKRKLEANAKAAAVTYQWSHLRSSSAAPFPATTFVVHTTPASAKKQLVGIKIELRHCSILSSIQRAVASQSLCCQTNQPAQQRSTRVPFARYDYCQSSHF
jgi:hypothetical protein